MRKINIDPKKPDPKSIKNKQSFNDLLNRYNELNPKANSNSFFNKGFSLNTVLLIVGITLIGTVIYLWPEKENKIPIISDNQQQIGNSDSSSFTIAPALKQKNSLDKLLAIDAAEQTKAPFINPPMPSIDIPYQDYKINSNNGGKFKYNNSSVLIPKSAFVDIYGKPIKGDIIIKYREFHDVIDFFVSGIPMEYDSADYTYTFESAGMVDIKGYQNDSQIFIAPNKKIEVNMESNTADAKYNLYYLDTIEKHWTYKGKDKVINETSKEEIVVSEDFFGDGELDYQSSIPAMEKGVSKLTRDLNQIKTKTKDFVKNNTPIEPTAYSSDNYTFNIDIDRKEFPELAVFEDLKFEVGDQNSNFSNEFYTIKWDDAKIEEHKAGKSYKLILSQKNRREELIVIPVFEGKDLEQAIEMYKQQLAIYNQKLKERNDAEKLIRQQLIAKQKELEAQRLMTEEQLAEKAKQRRENANSAIAVNEIITRSFGVTKFGTWNCDSPVSRPKGKSLAVTFVNKEGHYLGINYIRLVEQNRNASFNYVQYQFNDFKFNPKEKNYLLGFTPEMKFAYAIPEDFDKIKSNKNHTFALRITEEEIKTAAQLKQILAL